MATKVEIDTSKFERVGAKRLQEIISRASAHAINRAILATRTETIRRIGDATGIKRAGLIKRFHITKATRAKLLGAMFMGTEHGVPLSTFGPKKITVQSARGKRTGVVITVGGMEQLVPGGFLATMKNGKRGIFRRDGDERLPIRQMFSENLATLFSRSSLVDDLTAFAKENFVKNYNADFKYYSSQVK